MQIYKCNNSAVEAIKKDGECLIQGFGGSMEPILHSGDVFKFSLVEENTELNKNDIVFCKVHGNLFLHKITAINGERIQIGNNRGNINGWTTRKHIYGKFVEVIDKNNR